MQVHIKIDQRQALIEGINAPRETTLDFDPADLTPEQRVELAAHPTHNDILEAVDAKMWSCSPGVGPEEPKIVLPYLNNPGYQHEAMQALGLALDACIARRTWVAEQTKAEKEKQAKEATEYQARILAEKRTQLAELLEKRVEELVVHNGTYWTTSAWLDQPVKDFPAETAEILALALAEAKARNDAARIAIETTNARHKAKVVVKKTQVETWVREHGTDNQRERLEAGLLPEDEAVESMREFYLPPLAALDRYDLIGLADFCTCDDDDGYDDNKRGRLSCEHAPAQTVPAEVWVALKKARHDFPDFDWTPIMHKCTCSGCDQEMTRYGLKARITVGEFKFSREYAAK